MNYHLGILHLAHLLASVDGRISEEERLVLKQIQHEEGMEDRLVNDFVRKAAITKEADLYRDGIEYINRCAEDEKLCAFVHLYKLAEADASIHVREVRFLFYGVKSTRLEFDDVLLAAQLTGSQKRVTPVWRDSAKSLVGL
jgi:uncharacterized tellurite resistance protein B-like protein